MDFNPKVFGNSDVTIAVNQQLNCMKLYIGQKQIGFVQKLSLSVDVDQKDSFIELTFAKSHDSSINERIEENIRAVASFPWVKVVQAT